MTPAQPSPQPPPPPLQTNRPWLTVAGCLGGGVMTVVIVLLILLLVVLWVLFPDWFAIGRSQPSAQARVLVALGELSEKPALRVATREIAVQVEVAVPTEVTWRPGVIPIGHGFDIEVGRTTAKVTAPSNTVQYLVPVKRGAWSVRSVDEDCVVTLPPPVVDDADPAKMDIEVDRDWADHLVGTDDARNRALAAIRKAVLEQAASPVAMFEVREKARKTVADMIRALIDERHRPERIIVRWTDDPAGD
jgi:hypothetical protein